MRTKFHTARFLKYVWPFYNIMHERVKLLRILYISYQNVAAFIVVNIININITIQPTYYPPFLIQPGFTLLVSFNKLISYPVYVFLYRCNYTVLKNYLLFCWRSRPLKFYFVISICEFCNAGTGKCNNSYLDLFG